MADDGRLSFVITTDNSDQMKKAQQTINSLRNIGSEAQRAGAVVDSALGDTATHSLAALSSQADATTNAFRTLGSVFTGIVGVGSATAFAKQVFNVRSEMQNTEAAMRVFLGSAEATSEFLKDLQGYSYNNVSEFKDLAAQSAQLLAYKTSVEEVIPTLNKLSEIAAGTNAPLENLVAVFNKVKANDRLDSHAIMSLGNMGIDIYQTLADIKTLEEGINYDRDAVKGLSLDFSDLQKVIDYVSTDGGMFAGMMQEKMQTLGDTMGLMQDNLTNMFNEIGEKTQGFLKGGMDVGNYFIENYESVAKVLAAVVVSYGAVKAANLAMNVAQKSATGITTMDNAAWSIRATLLKANVKGDTDVAKVIKENVKAQEEQIAVLEQQVSAEQRRAILDNARKANLEEILTAQQKTVLAQAGITAESENYIPVATSMLNKEQSIALAQADLTNNNQAYIASLKKVIAANGELANNYDLLIAASQKQEALAQEAVDTGEAYLALLDEENEALTKKMQTAVAVGDAEEQQALQTKIAANEQEREAVQAEINAAAKQREVAAAEQVKLAEERETIAHTGNATATSQEAVKTGMLTGVKKIATAATKTLTTAVKRLWDTIKANPLGLILSVVMALYAGIKKVYQLINRNNIAIKEGDKTIKESSSKAAASIDALFHPLKNAEAGTKAYATALNKLKQEYPALIQDFLDEKGQLKDLEGAYKAVRDAAIEAATAKAKSGLLEQYTTDLEEDVGKKTEKIFANSLKADAPAELKRQISAIVDELKTGAIDVQEAYKKIEEADPNHYYTKYNNRTNEIVSLRGYLKTIYGLAQDYQRKVDALHLEDTYAKVSTGGAGGQADKHNKQYWQDQKEDAQRRLESMTTEEFNTAEGKKKRAKIEAEIREADKMLALYSAKDTSKAVKKQTDSYARALDEQGKKLTKMRRDITRQQNEAEIEGMEEGFAKSLATINAQYDRERDAIEEREEEMVKNLQDLAIKRYQDSHPDEQLTYEKEQSIRATVSKTDLTDEQRGILDDQFVLAEQNRNREIAQLLKTTVADYKDYYTQLTDLREQYNKDRAALVKAGADENTLAAFDKAQAAKEKALFDQQIGDYKTFQQKRADLEQEFAEKRKAIISAGGTEENLEKLNEDYATRLSSLLADEDAEYAGWLKNLTDATVKEMEKMLQAAKQQLKTLKSISKGDLTKEQSKRIDLLTAKINTLEGKIKDADLTPRQANAHEWKKIADVINDLGQEFSALGDAIDGTTGEVVSFIGETITGVGTTINTVIDGVEKASKATSAAIRAVETASVILAVISMAIQLIKQLNNLIKSGEEKKRAEEAAQATKEYNNKVDALTKSYEELNDAIEKSYGKDKQQLIDKQIALLEKRLKLERDNNKELNDQYTKLQTKKDKWESLSFWDKATMAPGDRHVLRWTDDDQAELDALEGKIKEGENSIADLERQYAQSKDARIDAIFGEDVQNAIESFGDALIEAWENQENMAAAVQNNITAMVKKALQQQLLSAIKNAKIMEEVRGRIADAVADDIITDEEMGQIIQLGETAASQLEQKYGAAFRRLAEMSDESSRSGSQRGIATASQESVDELNGRFTAVQMHVSSISANSNIMRDNIAAMLGSVMQIERHTQRLEAMEGDLRIIRGQITRQAYDGVRIR